MEQYQITCDQESLRVEGFPDAVKLIRLDDPKSRRISDLVLHRQDLEFADQCLEAINTVSSNSQIQEALWRCSLIHFVKCFGNSAARFQLSFEKIYKSEPSEAKVAFEYFRNLRDKHVVHDENSFSQSIPGAVLNARAKTPKIEKVLCLTVRAGTLEQENFGNLKLLIQKALSWVISEFDMCCDIVIAELDGIPHDDLLARDSVSYRAPGVEGVKENRRSK